MYKCSAAPVSLCFLFSSCSSLLLFFSLSFPFLTSYMHNCYLQWGGRSCAKGGLGGLWGIWLTRSPCRAMAAVGKGGGSSCVRCKATAGSSHSSPPPIGTGCGASAVAGKAPSRSWGRWCSPWLRRWTWAAPGVPACSRCRTHRCCRGWWEGRSDGTCTACNLEKEKTLHQSSDTDEQLVL